MKDPLQRYQWEDALIDAQSKGIIDDTALLVALKLSSKINWIPKKHSIPGLYWANEQAADAAGISRSTLYRGLKTLRQTGFLNTVNGNLIPNVPKSQSETVESQSDTRESQSETAKSQFDNPFTEDIFTDD